MRAASRTLDSSERKDVERIELEAIDTVTPDGDVRHALVQLQSMDVRLITASSLSGAAVTHFLKEHALDDFFSDVWTRDNAGGVRVKPLARAVETASIDSKKTIFLTDTHSGIHAAREAGVNPILMMNDPDEAMRLSMHDPAGGVVSLHELGDFIRLAEAENARVADS